MWAKELADRVHTFEEAHYLQLLLGKDGKETFRPLEAARFEAIELMKNAEDGELTNILRFFNLEDIREIFNQMDKKCRARVLEHFPRDSLKQFCHAVGYFADKVEEFLKEEDLQVFYNGFESNAFMDFFQGKSQQGREKILNHVTNPNNLFAIFKSADEATQEVWISQGRFAAMVDEYRETAEVKAALERCNAIKIQAGSV